MADCIVIDEKEAVCQTYRHKKNPDMETSAALVPGDVHVICAKTACVHNAQFHCMAEVFCVQKKEKRPECGSFWQI